MTGRDYAARILALPPDRRRVVDLVFDGLEQGWLPLERPVPALATDDDVAAETAALEELRARWEAEQ